MRTKDFMTTGRVCVLQFVVFVIIFYFISNSHTFIVDIDMMIAYCHCIILQSSYHQQ